MTENYLICEYSGLPSLSSYMAEQDTQKNKALDRPRLDFNEQDLDRIIQMAWEDRTPFEAIEFQFGLREKEVIELMRKNSVPSSFRMWRKRLKSRKTKHAALRNTDILRFKCNRQRSTGNKIAKR